MRRLLAFLCLLLMPLPALALQEAVYSTETFNQTYIFPNIGTFAPTPEGGLAWDTFAATTENLKNPSARAVTFSDDLKAQNGKAVKMRGYMFPLEDSEKQTRFLFGPFPMTCFYHFHTPPALVIEVSADAGIPFTYDPLIIEGVLVLENDPKREPYQRMTGAKLADGSETLVTPQTLPKKSFHPLFHKRMGVP